MFDEEELPGREWPGNQAESLRSSARHRFSGKEKINIYACKKIHTVTTYLDTRMTISPAPGGKPGTKSNKIFHLGPLRYRRPKEADSTKSKWIHMFICKISFYQVV